VAGGGSGGGSGGGGERKGVELIELIELIHFEGYLLEFGDDIQGSKCDCRIERLKRRSECLFRTRGGGRSRK
jgi:hypothetical protein